MPNQAITLDAIFTGFRTRADRSLGFTGMTPELSDIESVALMGIRQRNVKLLIQPTDGPVNGLVEVKAEFDEKRPSERLRAVLFVLHKQLTLKHQIAISFDEFYKNQMSSTIQSYKDQLEPATF